MLDIPRLIGSLHLQRWTRIGTMNRQALSRARQRLGVRRVRVGGTRRFGAHRRRFMETGEPRRDAELDADPTQAMSLRDMDSHIQQRRNSGTGRALSREFPPPHSLALHSHAIVPSLQLLKMGVNPCNPCLRDPLKNIRVQVKMHLLSVSRVSFLSWLNFLISVY